MGRSVSESAEPVDQIFALLGHRNPAPADRDDLIAAIATSLFLPDDSDVATVVSTLEHRKEIELAALVTAAIS